MSDAPYSYLIQYFCLTLAFGDFCSLLQFCRVVSKHGSRLDPVPFACLVCHFPSRERAKREWKGHNTPNHGLFPRTFQALSSILSCELGSHCLESRPNLSQFFKPILVLSHPDFLTNLTLYSAHFSALRAESLISRKARLCSES